MSALRMEWSEEERKQGEEECGGVVRTTGGAESGCDSGRVRGGAGQLRGAEPAEQSTGTLSEKAGREAGSAGGDMRGAVGGDSGGVAGDLEGGRGICATGSELSARAAGVHGEGCG